MKSSIKSFLGVLSSNLYNLVIGIILGFIIPKILGPINYGYWSLFTLYLSYAGVLIFGLADGLYLNYGGYLYEKLENNKIRTYYYIMFIYLIALVIFFNIIITFIDLSTDYMIIFRLLSIACLLTCINNFLILINQATARFRIYAFANILPKTLIVITTVLILIMKSDNYIFIIIGNIIGLLVSNVYLSFHSKDIVLGKVYFNKKNIKGMYSNIKAGISLTIAGVASMLMMGFGKFVIERGLGIEKLGYYSFAFSITAIFTQVIYAISTFIYPLVKRKPNEVERIFGVIDNSIISASGIILLLYFPCRYLMNLLFVDYAESFGCLVYLFPIVVCDTRIILTFGSKFKIERKERNLLYILLISIICCIIITLILFNMHKTIEIVALSTYLGFLAWQILLSINDKRYKISLDYIFELVYISFNIIFGWNLISFIGITMIYIIIYIINKKYITDNIRQLLLYIKK